MNEKNFDWDDLKLFLAVARAGGLSGAARASGKSAPTLGRRMLALEEITGHELFHRLPRGYELTGQGIALLDRVTSLEAQINPISRTEGSSDSVLVKVSAGSWMAHVLCQNIEALLKDNERTHLRFISAEQVLDITHRETIIGIRNRRPTQTGLACRKIAEVEFAGYATDENDKPWVRVVGNTPSAHWLASQANQGRVIEVTAPRNALDLACTGMARALLPTFIGNHQPGLKRVTEPVDELTHDQWLVTHQDERFRPEVRLTIDRIVEVIKSLHRNG